MKKQTIAIITFPISGTVALSNLVGIVYPLSNDLHLITGKEGYRFFKDDKRIHTYETKHGTGANTFTRILKYIYAQLKISYKLAKINGNVDMWIFFIGGDELLLPMLTAKLLREKVVLAFAGSSIQTLKSANDKLYKPLEILSKINCTLSNRIVLYSPTLIKKYSLEKYRNKISIAHEHFIDFDKFKIKKRFDERDNIVGFIGRLSEEKGVLNFVKAIPELSEERDEIRFLIIGDGELQNELEKYLDKNVSNDKVKLTGWISHDELPDYLNALKLVVLPSYTEGLPNIMLEAMACGTPVLATPVGAIPDVITNGETGFIMENNSLECIAENIILGLNHQNLNEIVKNARKLVKKEFTYEAAVGGWREILDNL